MSTQTIIALVIAAIVVVGGGYVVMGGGYSMLDVSDNGPGGGDAMGEKTKPGQINSYSFGSTNAGSNTTGTGGKAAPFTGSFFDLATRGGNYKCMVESNGAAVGTTGTVYVSGADLRGDFNSVVGGKTVESHMLKKGDDIYVWSSLMPQGMMMKATVMMGQGGAATQGNGVSGTQSYGWNCAAMGTDAAQFVVPGGIKFMDMSTMMQGASAGGSAEATMPKVPAY